MAASIQDIASAWEIVKSAFTPKNKDVEREAVSEIELQLAIELLINHGIGNIIEDWFMECLRIDLVENIGPPFHSHFSALVPKDSAIPFIGKVISELYENLMVYYPPLKQLADVKLCTSAGRDPLSSVNGLEESFVERAQTLFKAILLPKYKISDKIYSTVESFYTLAMNIYQATEKQNNKENDSKDVTDDVYCSGCNSEKEVCQCQSYMQIFHQVNQQLYELGLLERFVGEAVTKVVNERINTHIQNTCKGIFEASYLSLLETWLEDKVICWLSEIYQGPEGCSRHGDSRMAKDIQTYRSRLCYLLHETYAALRIEQLFNIIIEYPESEPAITDLKQCLEKTDLHSELVKSLKKSLEIRLLHPGVNTSDILSAYISSIRALRILDPTGVILELVCEPVRRYLRTRDDTIRCIVSSLTDDSSSELADELVKGEPLILDDSCHTSAHESSNSETDNWELWCPDPVEADPTRTSVSRRSSDIISMLVNIYGSKELFVNEYRTLLADRILSQFNYDTEKEIRYLELLKLRFGEAQLHYCEIMLKDVADSKRINTLIKTSDLKSAEKEEIPINAMILSAQFWPTFREDKLELPESISSALKIYTKNFEALKGNRTLSWKPHLGLVNLELELKDRKINVNCTPVHATIIMHFETKTKWTVEELSAVMHIPVSILRRKIAFWQSQGLLKEETTDTFYLVEEGKEARHDVAMIDMEEEEESAMASSHDQREEELQVFWSYIVGMLTNLESLALDKIHTMLKMFAMQGPATSECSVQELKHFLDRKVKEQQLTFSGGMYRLPKTGS